MLIWGVVELGECCWVFEIGEGYSSGRWLLMWERVVWLLKWERVIDMERAVKVKRDF